MMIRKSVTRDTTKTKTANLSEICYGRVKITRVALAWSVISRRRNDANSPIGPLQSKLVRKRFHK